MQRFEPGQDLVRAGDIGRAPAVAADLLVGRRLRRHEPIQERHALTSLGR